jgi:hypothetical protein
VEYNFSPGNIYLYLIHKKPTIQGNKRQFENLRKWDIFCPWVKITKQWNEFLDSPIVLAILRHVKRHVRSLGTTIGI